MMMITDVNKLEATAFIAPFGNSAEQSLWLTQHAASRLFFVNREAMSAAFRHRLEDRVLA